MGRPRTPIRIAEASGAVAKNPQRYRDRVLEPTCASPLGPPPEEWISRIEVSTEARALVNAWNEIADALALVGLGCEADRLAVRAACQLKVRVDRPGFKMGDFNGYRAMLHELGLTQAGRSACGRPAKQGSDDGGEFGDFRRFPARRFA